MGQGDHSPSLPLFLLLLLLPLRPDNVAGNLLDSLQVLYMCTDETPFLISGTPRCSQYVMCVHGVKSLNNCPPGMIFHKSKLSCDWPTRDDVKRCYRSIDGYTQESCPANSALLLPIPDSCAMYIDCGKATKPLVNDNHVFECPYPQFFSVTARKCVDFRQGESLCRGRPVPKSPCDYRQYQQVSPVAATCKQRHPSCLGMRDGIHPVSVHATYGYFVRCFRERTIDAFSCTKRQENQTSGEKPGNSNVTCVRQIY
ncbi:hypothetical protein BaRGS_00022486 [Batillaria attramentaria]|uniref:Chitin-binding type-2 domain-containing protein n=1 Tax=Batillaria attramentaria TaxID=370345 RepID=A0ABD0KGZ2_9CAEN